MRMASIRFIGVRPVQGKAAGVLSACALVSGLALALAGCSGSSGSGVQPGPGGNASGTTSSSSHAAPSSGSYGSSSDVVSALKSAGHPCTPVSGDQTSVSAPGLRSITACVIGSSGGASDSATDSSSSTGAVTATVFDDHTDAQAYAALFTSGGSSGLLIGGTSERAVLGQNWVVLVPDDAAYASQVSSALGGTVLGGASASAG